VLQQHVAEVGAAPRNRRGTPDAALDVLSRLIEDDCRHLHGRYVASMPELRAVVESARKEVPVRLTARRRSARAVKMTLAARRRAPRRADGRVE
jgi:hypothetical protein